MYYQTERGFYKKTWENKEKMIACNWTHNMMKLLYIENTHLHFQQRQMSQNDVPAEDFNIGIMTMINYD